MECSMIKPKGISNTFWSKVVTSSFYLRSKCPTKSVKGINAQESWIGKKPCMAYLKVFRCITYFHVPVKQHKMDYMSEKCIFVGYNGEIKGL